MPESSWIGRSLSGRYQIESLLGQGGMSSVYKATDPNLKRVVAVKLIHPHLSSDAQFIQRFEEEATAVASLRHSNIVQVYDFNSDQGIYYMVLEFVPGETLQDRLKRLAAQKQNLSVKDAIQFTVNICDALGYAHKRGMIHRDIKPANIMLDIYGQAILMDFGIVKIIGGTSHTVTGAVMGTARYISPEVIRAEPADQRSDIYSLGITLYEMLSGQAPFQSDSAMTLMMMHLNDPVPDPRMLRADIPAGLVKILLKSLEKDRAKRYQSAAEMAADLKGELAKLESGAVASPTVFAHAHQPAAADLPIPAGGNSSAGAIPQPVQTGMNYTSTTVYDPGGTRTAQPPSYNTPQSLNSPSMQYASIPAQATAKKSNKWLWLLGIGGGIVVIFFVLLAGAGLFYFSRNFGAASLPPPDPTVAVTASPVITSTQVAAVIPATGIGTPTLSPSDTPVPTIQATATYPPLYVRIDSITISGNHYEVNYETFGYTEKLPGMHVHFFFNTVPPDQAGMPGSGPWYLYGGPRPFTKYKISQRPAAATQMCALVAHPDHSVIANSGNCVDLPKTN